MFKSFRIGRIFGVPTDLHWSFLLVPAAILFYAYEPARGMVWGRVRWWSAITLLLFTFVLLHELGHALMAKNRGVVAERIILFPLGGGALIPEAPGRTRDEVLVYLAGPLANVVLALLALPLLLLQPDGNYLLRYFIDPFSNLVVYPTLFERLLGITLAVNALLAVGNLLPAYPLDGGRIVRALLKRPLGDRRATVTATLLGILIGGVLLALAWPLRDPLLGISACFIMAFSAAELNRGWQRRRIGRTELARVLRPPGAERLYANDTVARSRELFGQTPSPVLPVYDSWNELRGFVAHEVLEAEASAGDRVARFYEPEFVTATETDNLLEVTERIVAADVYGAAVYDTAGRVVGFVYTHDVIGVLDASRRRRIYRKLTLRAGS